MAQEIPHRILRLPAVLEAMGGIGKSKHYQDIEDGLMSHPVPIGAHAVGWPLRDVVMLNAARIAGKSNDEIRALVVELEEARSSALDEAMALAGMRPRVCREAGVRL